MTLPQQLSVAGTLLLSVAIASAANINWQTPINYSAPSDIRTDGVLVEAINATGEVGAASPVINGVTFTADTTLLEDDATTDFLSGDTGDIAYNQFLNSLDLGSDGSFSIGDGRLESGKEYLVQAWYVDERSNSDDRAMQFSDGNGNLSDGVNDQFVIGTFIADATSQTFIVYGVESGPHFTGYQLRDLSSALPTLNSSVGTTVSSAFDVSVNFSESISGLTANDFSIVNGAVTNVSGSGSSWTITVTPTNNGDVQVILPANTVLDNESHGNVSSNTILTTYVPNGADQPVPTLSTTATDVTGEYTVNIQFSEPVIGLELSDFIVSSATLSNLSGSGSNYTLTVSPNFGGDVALSLPRNSVIDGDGDALQNVESNELVTSYHITITVHSPEALIPYLTQDNVTATLTHGTYTIDADDVRNTYGTPRFEFWGSNSTYDFSDSTINFAADIYESDLSMNHIQIFGNNNVLKNLRMIDQCDKYGDVSLDGGVNIIIDGMNNRVEGFFLEIRGSYPYGYGDCFGKGGTYTIKHSKHSGILVRGTYNHLLNCTLMQESYGHCIFMQAASYPTIEGCYVEAEVRSTDDMLAETSGPAFDIDFMTVWGFRLPPGYMKATCEGGIRAYNGGNTYIDGVWISRGTDNPTILNNTLVNTRTGVTLTHATGDRYVYGCTTIGTERGYAIGAGVIDNCYSDVKHGPAFGVDYESDRGITADITIIPHEGPHYNGSRHIAYITGSNHHLTFRGDIQNPELELEVNMGGDRRIESSSNEVDDYSADNIIINNLTGYPLVFDDNTSNNDGQSIGTIIDAGSSNSITQRDWNVLSNLAHMGTATHSSDAFDTLASFATDLNTNGSFFDGSVTHTDNEDQPWWQIDLNQSYDIGEIRIWNRTGSNESRLSDYDVSVLNADEQVVWSNYQADYPDPSVSLLPDTNGRYVRVQLRGNNPLSLAEVEIFEAKETGPSGLTVDSDQNQILLNWNSVTNASQYTVRRGTSSGGPYTSLGTTNQTNYTDSAVINGTTYYYIITATVDGAESSPSFEVAASYTNTAKLAISSDAITASEYQEPNLPANTIDDNYTTRWSANGDGQWIRYDLGSLKIVQSLKIAWLNGSSRVADYEIEVSDDDSTWSSVTDGIVQSSGTTNDLQTEDVTDTLARYVRIVGYGNSSNGWNSINEVEIWGVTAEPPLTPTNFTLTPSDGQVTLNWNTSANATLHHLKRSTSGRFYTTISSQPGNVFLDTDVTNGTTYYYVISAENDYGESADSTPVKTKPYAPISQTELTAPIPQMSGNRFEFTLQSILGRIYQLQRNETLAPEGWENLGDPVLGNGNSITLEDPEIPDSSKCFYRLEIEP